MPRAVLGGDEEAMLLLAEKIVERPDAFRRIARLDDKALDRLLAYIDDDGTLDCGEQVVARRAGNVDPA